MKKTVIRKTKQEVPAILVGCMRQAGFTDAPFSPQQMNHFIHTAVEHGANYFDHADIYGFGRAETVFGEAMKLSGSTLKREDLILQSKCGIRQGCFDSSRGHILEAVDGILKRLQTGTGDQPDGVQYRPFRDDHIWDRGKHDLRRIRRS